MRALHLTRDFPPRVNGGLSTAVGGLVAASRAAGVECKVVSFDAWRPKGRARAPRLPATDDVVRVGAREHLAEAQSFARSFEPDVVHVHDALLFEQISLACPRVLSVHVNHAAQRALRGLDTPNASERAEERAFPSAALVTAPSEATRRELTARGVDAALVPLGVTIPEVPKTRADSLLYVGRFADVKGTDELFSAVDGLDVRVLCAGGLPDSPRSEARYRERAPANVELLGWLSPGDLEARYAEASVLIAPSWHETFGLAVAEAMSHGVPVVASDAGALRERVVHERTGLLVPPRDVDGLRRAIERLVADESLRGRMGDAARAAAAEWPWSRAGDALLRAYAEIVDG